ncbi:MAG: amidase family protein [Pseudohongiellaceae bacterium]
MYLQRRAKFQIAVLMLLPMFWCQVAHSAETTGSIGVWQRYDQAADLATLAAHENDSMHFQRLLSPVQDKNDLWAPFTDELAAFGDARYQQLKPLILEADIESLHNAVAAGQFSYVELTTFYIYRIREIELDNQRYLNAVISLNPQAIALARLADQRRMREAIDPFSMVGIPVLLKDNIGTASLPTTAGALALQYNQTRDAFIAAQLKNAGAIILGKANLSEWAYFFCQQCPSGYSAMGGQTLNPYGRFEFGTGGSSSGSGTAMAANLASVAVGSETSGSILSPASSQSVVGLKPTTGSLSRSGVVPISSTLDTTGPITRSVADAVIVFNAMAGFDPADSAMPRLTMDYQLMLRQIPLSDKRLGVLVDFADVALYQQALSKLSAAGATLTEAQMPDLERDGFSELLGGDMVRDLETYLADFGNPVLQIDSIAALQAFNNAAPEQRAPYGQALVDMMASLELSDAELAALRERLQTAARESLDALFRKHELDVLLSYNNRNAGIAALANYPALTIPMGYDENGRPMGLTLIAPSFQEQELVDVGLQFERLSQARRVPAGYE